jgi:2-polyprenyl-6-methoxyphenol hydroxylase-like FAD-dependent oxidoreductase
MSLQRDVRRTGRMRGGHAVVAGGGVSGLLAARVLSEHFDQVTLIERGTLAHDNTARKETPQANHIHGLLIRGEALLNEFFPGFSEELEGYGANRVYSDEVAMHHYGGWKVRSRFDGRYHTLVCSRSLIEWRMVERLKAIPNIAFIESTVLKEPALNGGKTAVEAVLVTPRQEQGGAGARLACDLLFDATGRASKLQAWLESNGKAQVSEERMELQVSYATRLYDLSAVDRDWKVLSILPTPPNRVMGVVFPIEDGKWMVTLAEWFADAPQKNLETYMARAKRLEHTALHETITAPGAKPLSEIHWYYMPFSRRRYVERSGGLPDGYLCGGDALCAFNPVYGQGISVCALQAKAMAGALSSGRLHEVRKAMARASAFPWQLSTTEDLRYPENPLKPSIGQKILHWYSGRMHEACLHDENVLRVAGEVNHMLRHPASVFRPDIVWRVLTRRSAGEERSGAGAQMQSGAPDAAFQRGDWS